MSKKISFAGPWITEKEMDAVLNAVKSGWYENYTRDTEELIDTVCSYTGMKYAIPTHCCTLALHLATASLGLGKGDEVIVTDHSWVATAYAITYTGAKCIFVDIDPETLCIDPQAIENAITENTKAIMLVHNFGLPADMNRIMDIAKLHRLKVIEDAAPAMGSTYKGHRVGTFGDVSCFSFQGAKIAVAGEGGVYLTNNEEVFQKATLLANMGRTDRVMPFWSDSLGYQYTISNLSAALANVQMKRIDELVEKKRQLFIWYRDRLMNHPKISVVHEQKDTFGNYCYPSIFIKDSDTPRDEILTIFRDHNIHARPGFPQMSNFPIYVNDKRFENPVAKRFEKNGLVLPSAANLDENDIDFVCEILLKLL
ncbi:DegT/DnrJ/EryC1/StrS family aminotransferase [Lachnospiraceae bacterium ZAX-1]